MVCREGFLRLSMKTEVLITRSQRRAANETETTVISLFSLQSQALPPAGQKAFQI